MQFLSQKENSHNLDFPIHITKHKKDKDDIGCMFNWHEELEIYYVVSGGAEILCDGHKEMFYAGDVCYINWCQPHKSTSFLKDTVHYVFLINVSNTIFSKIKDSLNKPVFVNNNKVLKVAFDNIVKLYDDLTDANKQKIIGELFIAFGELMEVSGENRKLHSFTNSRNQKLVMSIFEYIHSNYSDKISLTILSKELNVSEEHLCRVFKKFTGSTILEYLTRIRINVAVSMLGGDISIREISSVVGFDDYNYFSRTFKKIIGASPLNYIKANEK